jgi:hypothetical protein
MFFFCYFRGWIQRTSHTNSQKKKTHRPTWFTRVCCLKLTVLHIWSIPRKRCLNSIEMVVFVSWVKWFLMRIMLIVWLCDVLNSRLRNINKWTELCVQQGSTLNVPLALWWWARQDSHLYLRIKRYGVRFPLRPKQSVAIFSVHLLQTRLFWWFTLYGPYAPRFSGWLSPSDDGGR